VEPRFIVSGQSCNAGRGEWRYICRRLTNMDIKYQFSKKQSCRVTFGAVAEYDGAIWRDKKVLVLTDTNTALHCWPILKAHLSAAREVHQLTLPAGEAHKTIETCDLVWSEMTRLQLNRNDVVVVLGGGVLGDLGGFCAATYKRGVPFVLIPTTLLSMVDSSIGGKLGVDYQGIKNLVGVFALPEVVLIDAQWLATLAREQMLSGMAEVLKHAAIGQRNLFSKLLASDDFFTQDWLSLIEASVRIKHRVVRSDPYEQGLRKLLNFGHTIGHALESQMLAQGTPITHGHAIALGMLVELQEAPPQRWVKELKQLIIRHFDTSILRQAEIEQLWSYMLHDKKKSDSTVKVALPDQRLFTLAETIWVFPGQIRLV
jgi:3-dehydroquinate synthase